MEFPIVYNATVIKNKGLIIFIMILGVLITGGGIAMRIALGDSEGSMSGLFIGLFFLVIGIALVLLGKLRAKQEANTNYTIDHDCFVLFYGKKETSERFYYQDYLFSGRIQRVNGSPFFTLIMEDRNGKKHKRNLVLFEDSFRSLLDDVVGASVLFQNSTVGV